MSFIRPEAANQILRWREAIIGTGLLIPGLWWAFAGSGLMPYIGGALIILGALLIFVGIQRARFRIPGDGPGIVQVTEDQVTYFGPLTGGAVALSDLTHLSLQGDAKPAHWVLSQPTQPDLHIPVTADGAEALFDAFARLPALRTEHMLAQMHAKSAGRVLIWARSDENVQRLKHTH